VSFHDVLPDPVTANQHYLLVKLILTSVKAKLRSGALGEPSCCNSISRMLQRSLSMECLPRSPRNKTAVSRSGEERAKMLYSFD